MHRVIYDHLTDYAPLLDSQWGFQSGKSTVSALLSATQDWFTSLDQRKDICCVFFFDLQKAFDTVPHGQLMTKLERTHLHPVLLKWLHNYLYRREQSVVVNGEHLYLKLLLLEFHKTQSLDHCFS